MKKFDYSSLDGNTLKAFIALIEESSVSRAAERLNVSQSGLSHTLGNLRIVLADELFVRAGRGIEPTVRARELAPRISALLDDLNGLGHLRAFDPHSQPMRFTIASNDFPLHFIFPVLLRELTSQGIRPEFRFIPAGVPSVGRLHNSDYQLIITPAPPKGPDVRAQPLFSSKMEVFYDAATRKPPRTWRQFLKCPYVDVRFSYSESSTMVLPGVNLNQTQDPAITVPNFSALTTFIKGTDMITSQLGAMHLGLLSTLDKAPLPIKTEPLTIYMVWHRRDDEDPSHVWLRTQIAETVNNLFHSE
jgi:DNA-binding transcriptional LysR family regulator